MAVKEAHIDLLFRALYFADRSGVKTFHTGCVIVKNDKIISTGWSHYGMVTRSQYRSVHAELSSILRAPTKDDLDGATIYVAMRRVKSGTVGIAQPCKFCNDLAFEVGIKDAYWTINNKDYGYSLISDLDPKEKVWTT